MSDSQPLFFVLAVALVFMFYVLRGQPTAEIINRHRLRWWQAMVELLERSWHEGFLWRSESGVWSSAQAKSTNGALINPQDLGRTLPVWHQSVTVYKKRHSLAIQCLSLDIGHVYRILGKSVFLLGLKARSLVSVSIFTVLFTCLLKCSSLCNVCI